VVGRGKEREERPGLKPRIGIVTWGEGGLFRLREA